MEKERAKKIIDGAIEAIKQIDLEKYELIQAQVKDSSNDLTIYLRYDPIPLSEPEKPK